MIPSISSIIDMLLANEIDRGQAINWLHEHAKGSANKLRDEFAGLALSSIVTAVYAGNVEGDNKEPVTEQTIAEQAYAFADAMLAVRGV